MSTGRWFELRAKHEARCTEEGISLVITMSKISGVAEGLYGLVVWGVGPEDQTGDPVGIITKRFPLLVVSREFQPTCLAFRWQAIRTGTTPGPLRSLGCRAKRKRQGLPPVLPAIIICMAKDSDGSDPERVLRGGLCHGELIWLCRFRLLVCLCGGRHICQAGRLDLD
jgi:hypothetical protein